ncbi:MAG: phytanoyl-CoA dioxygenase family protein [Candidatus Dormibacteria bacterium]
MRKEFSAEMTWGQVITGQLVDATADLQVPGALSHRLAVDGYAFLPGLVPAADIAGLREQVLSRIAGLGWLEEGSDPAEARPGTAPVVPYEDERWWEGYVAIQELEDFHALAHHPSIRAVMASVVDPELLVQPLKIARVTYPSTDYPTPAHQDFYFVRGAYDVFTAWIPLADCPIDLGGLHVLAGSHREGLKGVVPARGAGGIAAEVPDGVTWLTTDYRAGDVLMFHSLLVHFAPANHGERLRLSADFRYQSSRDPIVTAALLPHEFGNGRVPGWQQLSRSWSSAHCIEVPAGIRLASWRPEAEEPVPSRLLAGRTL